MGRFVSGASASDEEGTSISQYSPLVCVCEQAVAPDGSTSVDCVVRPGQCLDSIGWDRQCLDSIGWDEIAWLSAGFTFLCALCSMAYVSCSESMLLPEIALTLCCVSFGASAAGYSYGRRSAVIVQKQTKTEPVLLNQISPMPSLLVEPSALHEADKMQKMKTEGVVDAGWLGEYVDFGEDDGTATKNFGRLRSRQLSNYSLDTRPQLSPADMRQSRHVTDMQQLFLGDLDWNCDTCEYAKLSDVQGKPILGMGLYLMDHHALVESIPDWMLKSNVSEELTPKGELRLRVQNFLSELDHRYLDENAYHNRTHACDVMKNVKCFFDTELLQSLRKWREWTWFISVLAAAIHDVGHTGQTNNYHIAIRSPLALLYNDKSPLEQMHVSTAFQLMNENIDMDWFGAFLKEITIKGRTKMMQIQGRFRRALIAMVLATDNLWHNECVERLGKLIANEDVNAVVKAQSDTQLLVLETVLHGADIAHPSYDLPLHISWSSKVLQEFWSQGDLEKKVLGAASMPMFDRDKMDVPGAQVGFFKFIALGLWEPLSVLLPEMECRLEQMRRNLEYWEYRKEKGFLAIPVAEEIEQGQEGQDV